MEKWICPICKKEYPKDSVTQITKDLKTVICLNCANVSIDVYQCGPIGLGKFTTDDISEVMEFIKSSEINETLEIIKRKISRIKYLDAEEFQGF